MNWKSKLTSRKWWAAITGVVVSVMVLFNVDSQQSERITYYGSIFSCGIYHCRGLC